MLLTPARMFPNRGECASKIGKSITHGRAQVHAVAAHSGEPDDLNRLNVMSSVIDPTVFIPGHRFQGSITHENIKFYNIFKDIGIIAFRGARTE